MRYIQLFIMIFCLKTTTIGQNNLHDKTVPLIDGGGTSLIGF